MSDSRYVEINDPKFLFDTELNCLVNNSTKEPIPAEEPIFILRGKDEHTPDTIEHYLSRLNDGDHAEAVGKRLEEFLTFKAKYYERVKEPDTELSVCVHCGSNITKSLQPCNATKGMCESV